MATGEVEASWEGLGLARADLGWERGLVAEVREGDILCWQDEGTWAGFRVRARDVLLRSRKGPESPVREGIFCVGRGEGPSHIYRYFRNRPKPWSINSRLMMEPPASITART